LALMSAAQKIKQLPELPTADDMDELAEPWRPWRAVAARVLWHYYLNGGKSS
jgi:DNA-3-methyladenine glycosylase II